MSSKSVLLVPAILIALSGPAVAAWVPGGSAVCTEDGGAPQVAPDGAGGSIVAWVDQRNTNDDIYVQHLDAFGNPQWTANGVALCTASSNQTNVRILSDGNGGGIVVWQDYRNGSSDIYARRVDADGTPLWVSDGVGLCTAANNQLYPRIVSDGEGGAIVVWEDYRNTDADIYAQRVDAGGTSQWTAGGVAVCNETNNQTQPQLVPDGSGGMVVAWQDARSNPGVSHIYAQRMDSTGIVQWAVNGVAVSMATLEEQPVMATDGAGGAIVTWIDHRNGGNTDAYAQLVDGAGIPQWTPNGVPVCTEGSPKAAFAIAADGMGGAVVTWEDARNFPDFGVFAQRIDATGNPRWIYDGLALCTAAGHQMNPKIAAWGGNFIICWEDDRGGTQYDIYAQAVTPSGGLQWNACGTPVCTDPGTLSESAMSRDEAGGVVIAWTDLRTGGPDIYAQRVETTYGTWGHPEPVLDTVADIPNDQGGRVAVNWTASGRDLPTPRAISRYSIWRAVDMIPSRPSGAMPTVLIDLGGLRRGAAGPVYASLAAVPGYTWELVGTQDAHGWPGYSFSADTRADSVSGDTGTEVFMVAAHDQYDDYVAYPSNAASGHSVDNLAPAAPLMLTAIRVGNEVHLTWKGGPVPDLLDYAVYRAEVGGVLPLPVNFLSASPDTHWVDTGVPTSALYYIVTAKDVHENQSDPSNEVVVGTETGVGGTLPVTALRVLANRPNPFAGSTLFRVGLPADAPVRVEVFDVTGRRVRVQNLTGTAGWQDLVFDGRDDAGRLLPGGTYFYRVAAAGKTITRKILITR